MSAALGAVNKMLDPQYIVHRLFQDFLSLLLLHMLWLR
jgi:hypothetical protein